MRLAPASALHARLVRVRAAMAESRVDALLVTHLPNVAYLANLFASAGALVVTRDAMTIVIDGRYAEAVRELLASPHAPEAQMRSVAATYDETIADTLVESEARAVGIEGESMTVARHAWFAKTFAARAPEATIVSTERMVSRARLVKDAHELTVLREAARLLSRVAMEAIAEAQPGRTEHEVAARIDFAVKSAGFERAAFDTIVASGPHAALPHARPTARLVQPGELVVLDFGGVYGGYCVDLTRTVLAGGATRADPEVERVFAAVRAAHAAAVASIKPGVRGWDVDAAARRALGDRGLGDAFTHGTGHGLGLEIHEDPRIVQRRPNARDDTPGGERLAPGMVFTVEPGAYLPGWGGVRIEDDVAVTGAGCEVLTDVPIALEWPPR